MVFSLPLILINQGKVLSSICWSSDELIDRHASKSLTTSMLFMQRLSESLKKMSPSQDGDIFSHRLAGWNSSHRPDQPTHPPASEFCSKFSTILGGFDSHFFAGGPTFYGIVICTGYKILKFKSYKNDS